MSGVLVPIKLTQTAELGLESQAVQHAVAMLQHVKPAETTSPSHYLPAHSFALAAQAAYSMYTEAVQMLEAGGPDGISGDVYRQAIGELRVVPRALLVSPVDC